MSDRIYTNAEAMEAALALVDEHFHNGKRKTKFCIPAELDDTDLTLCGYLRQAEAQQAAAKRELADYKNGHRPGCWPRWLEDEVAECQDCDPEDMCNVHEAKARAAMAKEQK